MASILHDALAESKTPLAAPTTAAATSSLDLDTVQIDQIIGAKGHVNAGVYQIGVARRDEIMMGGMATAPAGPMGMATGINFQPTGGGKTAITGDFVLTSDEVNPVVKALRSDGIEITAIHSHMLEEQPRLFFLHFWTNDDAIKLARVLSTALNATNRASRH